MSPDVVLASSLALALTIGWMHRRYLDSTDPTLRKPRSTRPVVTSRDLFGKPSAPSAGCPDAA